MANLVSADKKIVMKISDFDHCMDKLIDANLIEKNGKLVELTSKGSLLSDYIDRSHYKNLCRDMLKFTYRDHQDILFWKLVDVTVDHAQTSLDILTWDKPTVPSESQKPDSGIRNTGG